MASTTPRFGTTAADNKTGSAVTYDFKQPAYAASIALKPNAFDTTVVVGQLTGALSMTAATARAHAGDRMTIHFNADGTNRTVTFSTGFKPSATLTVTASKKATASFQFDGAHWVETGRAIEG